MAEITAVSRGRKRAGSLQVDLTPMVDLGFLLISFFVFTSTLSESKALVLALPHNGPPMDIPESGAVTLIIRSEGIYYYKGNTPQNKKDATLFTHKQKEELRQTLVHVRTRLISRNGNDEKLMVLIKPGDDADLGMLVDLFDEMQICGIKRHTLAELNGMERSW